MNNMKKLFVAVVASACAIASSAAHAEAWFKLQNQAGGWIVMTNRACMKPNTSGQSMAYSTMPDYNMTQSGCYIYDDASSAFLIEWDDGTVRSYAWDSVQKTPEFVAAMARFNKMHPQSQSSNNQYRY